MREKRRSKGKKLRQDLVTSLKLLPSLSLVNFGYAFLASSFGFLVLASVASTSFVPSSAASLASFVGFDSPSQLAALLPRSRCPYSDTASGLSPGQVWDKNSLLSRVKEAVG